MARLRKRFKAPSRWVFCKALGRRVPRWVCSLQEHSRRRRRPYEGDSPSNRRQFSRSSVAQGFKAYNYSPHYVKYAPNAVVAHRSINRYANYATNRGVARRYRGRVGRTSFTRPWRPWTRHSRYPSYLRRRGSRRETLYGGSFRAGSGRYYRSFPSHDLEATRWLTQKCHQNCSGVATSA